jgi:phosphate transport system protein
MAIDEQCLEILARYQPAGRDLRFVSRGLKIATDLERIGDLSLNTAHRVKEILAEGEAPIDLTEMADIVQAMLRDALDAFVNADVAKAGNVLEEDDKVDAMTERFCTELVDRSMKKPQNLRRYFPATSIVRYLERIADHATNIAEIAIFVAKGRDVRHGHLQ